MVKSMIVNGSGCKSVGCREGGDVGGGQGCEAEGRVYCGNVISCHCGLSIILLCCHSLY